MKRGDHLKLRRLFLRSRNLGNKRFVVAVLIPFLLGGGVAAADHPAGRSKSVVRSIATRLDAPSCRTEIDPSDPNETPHRVCPGVGGYSLIERPVESGRTSLDVVDPTKVVFPLNLHEVVTRHMFSPSSRVEWRVLPKKGGMDPMALIIDVQAHEDSDDPEKVTQTYRVVARISQDQTCVTDVISGDGRSGINIRSLADSARERPCRPPLPPLTMDMDQ